MSKAASLSLPRVLAAAIAVAVLPLPLRAAETPRPEFWLAAQPPGRPGTGTADDPYDASTQAKFDGRLSSFGPGAAIHLLPGTYLTGGWGDGTGKGGFVVRSGWTLSGAGMGKTVVRLAALTPQPLASYRHVTIANAFDADADGATVSDLTVDCNAGLTPPRGDVIDAVRLSGNRVTIRNVEAVNAFATMPTRSQTEGFALVCGTLAAPGGRSTAGALIEGCAVRRTRGSYVTAISIGKGYPDPVTASGTIRNCVVEDNPWQAFSGGGCDGLLVTGNQCRNSLIGFRCDTGDMRNIVISGNHFSVAGKAYWGGAVPIRLARYETAPFQNFSIVGNELESANRAGIDNAGISLVDGTGGKAVVDKVWITGNTFRALAPNLVFLDLRTPAFKNVFFDDNRSNAPNRIENADPSARIGTTTALSSP